MNCKDCDLKAYDGVDHVCLAHFDGQPGRPVVQVTKNWKPYWCPLTQPRRVTVRDLEKAMHPTIAAAIQAAFVKLGEPTRHIDTNIPEARSLPRGDR